LLFKAAEKAVLVAEKARLEGEVAVKQKPRGRIGQNISSKRKKQNDIKNGIPLFSTITFSVISKSSWHSPKEGP
jgi:hypothetical protein